jgi:2-polyprenyl-3-methyl-5-hydroxy-6-metoxy-1,4-benzoquinol methylase
VNKKTTDATFDYYQCSVCNLMFLSPMPHDMGPFYKGGYQTIPDNISQLRVIAKRERYRIQLLLQYKAGGRLLEIGPWMGIFSCNAKDAGFDVTAIEMDGQCVDFLNKIVGIKAIQSSQPEVTMSAMQEKFDVIALWHALEHLPQPWIVVREAAERLAPGGILLIAIPNIESYDYAVLREDWQHLDAPRHLFFYKARTLEELCSLSGLKTVAVMTNDRLSKILTKAAWRARADSMVPTRYLRRALGELFYYAAMIRGNRNGSGLTAIFAKAE